MAGIYRILTCQLHCDVRMQWANQRVPALTTPICIILQTREIQWMYGACPSKLPFLLYKKSLTLAMINC